MMRPVGSIPSIVIKVLDVDQQYVARGEFPRALGDQINCLPARFVGPESVHCFGYT